jgi:hypothetical protein
MKAVSLLFLFHEKKRIKNVPVVAAIMFKNGASKMVASDSGVLAVATALS